MKKLRRSGKGHQAFLSLSGILVAARLGGAACGMALMILLARTVEPKVLGEFNQAFSIAMLLAMLTTLNLQAGSLRFLSGYVKMDRLNEAVAFVRVGQRLAVASGIIVLAVVTIAKSAESLMKISLLENHTALGFVAAPVLGWLIVNASYAHVMGWTALAFVPRTFARHFLLLIAVAVLIAIGIELDAARIMLVFLITLLLITVLQTLLNRHALTEVLKTPRADYSNWRQWTSVGIQMIIPTLLIEFSTEIVIVFAAAVLPAAEVAVLSVILRLTGFIGFAIVAANQSIGPSLAAAIQLDDRNEVNKLLFISGRFKLWVAFAGLLLFTIGGHLILAVFGQHYTSGAQSLVILATVPVILAFAGPTALIMTVLKLHHYMLVTSVVVLVILYLLIQLLGRYYGLNGVAASVVIVWLVWNLSMAFIILKHRAFNVSFIGTSIGKAANNSS